MTQGWSLVLFREKLSISCTWTSTAAAHLARTSWRRIEPMPRESRKPRQRESLPALVEALGLFLWHRLGGGASQASSSAPK